MLVLGMMELEKMPGSRAPQQPRRSMVERLPYRCHLPNMSPSCRVGKQHTQQQQQLFRRQQQYIETLQQVSLTFDDGEDQRVQLIVHSLKPPFLDGRVSFSMQQVSQGGSTTHHSCTSFVSPLPMDQDDRADQALGRGGCSVHKNVFVGLSFSLTYL